MRGVPGLLPTAGPLANSFDDLDFFMRNVLGAEPWKHDEAAYAVGWNAPPPLPSDAALTIGVLPEDVYFPLHPPVRRALESAIAKLQAKGHRIVRLTNSSNSPYLDTAFISRLAFEYFVYSPHDNSAMTSTGEPPVKSVAVGASPMFTGPMPVDLENKDIFQLIDQLYIARSGVADAWRELYVREKLDVVLCPGAQNTAVPHDTYGWPPYTVIWNLLDVRFALAFFCMMIYADLNSTRLP